LRLMGRDKLKESGKKILKKVSSNSNLRKLQNEQVRLKKVISSKMKQLDDKMKYPPFIRTIDKCAFTVGIITMLLTEYVLLQQPQWMHIWYLVLIFPLMILRFWMYHKQKFHYFMLDFCYYCQVLLMFFLFFVPTDQRIFKMVFALTNGPLAIAIVMWRNSLVFHDVDKLTSLFIHYMPALVTFSVRWYNPIHQCPNEECWLTFGENFVFPTIAYLVWQIFYSLKTEVISKQKIVDEKIMTSSQWLSGKKPHPIYKWSVNTLGYTPNPAVLLAVVQFVYNEMSFLPVILAYRYFWFHIALLFWVFLTAVWNGASFYFEIFTESYSKRLETFFNEAKVKKQNSVKFNENSKSDSENKSEPIKDDAKQENGNCEVQEIQ